MSRSTWFETALSAAFIASAAIASPALALESKQCLPLAQMNAALHAEGQHTMLVGDREDLVDANGNPTNYSVLIKDAHVKSYMNVVTSNDDGSTGYQIEGDKPRVQYSTQLCVRLKLTNIRMFDASRPGVPQAALLGGAIDKTLISDEKVGARPAILADTLHRAANGEEQKGLSMIITANVASRAGSMYARAANGTPIDMMLLGDLDYTKAGLDRVRGNAALAMNDLALK